MVSSSSPSTTEVPKDHLKEPPTLLFDITDLNNNLIKRREKRRNARPAERGARTFQKHIDKEALRILLPKPTINLLLVLTVLLQGSLNEKQRRRAVHSNKLRV